MFKFTSDTSIFQTLKQQRAVVNGKHPLDGWRHKAFGTTSVIRKGTTIVVLKLGSDLYDDNGDDFVYITTYWVTNENEANAILDQVRGKITWETMWSTCKNIKWSGGPVALTVDKTFYHLVNL